ncbi:glycosyltransferase family 1 protein, partial [Streptomyces mirabilis]
MTDTTMDQASPKPGPVSPKTGQASAKTGPAAANGDQASLNYVPVQHTALKNAEIIPMSLRSVHFVMPGGVDDASAPSGGNAYDRRLCLDLPGFGWQVHKHA